MANEFAKELKSMDAQWKDAPEDSNLPEGVYSMTIESAELKRSQNTGKLRVSIRFVVSEGEHLGAAQYDGFTLTDNPSGMSMLKQFLSKLGMENPDSMEDIPDVLADISNKQPLVSAQVKKNGDYTNVRLLELLEGETESSGGEEEEAADSNEEEGGAEEESGEEETVELGVGVKVTFSDDDGNEYTGTISKKNKNGTFDVENDEISAPGMKAEDLTPVAEEEEEEEDGEDKAALLELAIAHELAEDLSEESDIPTIVEALSSGEWKEEELEEGEIAILKKYEIEVAKKKKAAPVMKKKPAPAKKAAPAPTKKAPMKKKK